MNFGIRKETAHYKGFTGGGAQNTAGTTAYAPIGGTTNYNANERNRQTLVARYCKISNLTIVTGTAQPASGTMVFTLRKNGVDTSMVITIPINAAAGTFADTTHSVTFSPGDLISLKSVNNASGNSAELIAWSFRVI